MKTHGEDQQWNDRAARSAAANDQRLVWGEELSFVPEEPPAAPPLRPEPVTPPAWVQGLDQLLEQGFRLVYSPGGAGAPRGGGPPSVAVAGPPRSGKTTLALHVASTLCRSEPRGAVLYLTGSASAQAVWALLVAYGNIGFSWVVLGGEPVPVVPGAVLVLQSLLPPQPGGGLRAQQVTEQVLAQQHRLPAELPLRVVVADEALGEGQDRDQGVEELQAWLHDQGIALVLVGESAAPAEHVVGLQRADAPPSPALLAAPAPAPAPSAAPSIEDAWRPLSLLDTIAPGAAPRRVAASREETVGRSALRPRWTPPAPAPAAAVAVTPTALVAAAPAPAAPSKGAEAPVQRWVPPPLEAPPRLPPAPAALAPPAARALTPAALSAPVAAAVTAAVAAAVAASAAAPAVETAPAVEAAPAAPPPPERDAALEKDEALRGLCAPTGIPGLDRLLSGGLRLLLRSALAPCPAATVAVSGASGTGKTLLALHLAAALCRAHGRGAALCLSSALSVQELQALARGYGGAGFAWLHSGAEAPPSGGVGLWLETLPAIVPEYLRGAEEEALGELPELPPPAPAGPQATTDRATRPPRPPTSARAPEGRGRSAPWALWSERAQQVLAQVLRVRQRLGEQALRVVVLDDVVEDGPERPLEGLLLRLLHAGISVVLVGPGPLRADHQFVLEQDETEGRLLRITKTYLADAYAGPHLLQMEDGALRVLPLAPLVPELCGAPEPEMRVLPPGCFGDGALDQRAGGKPWLTPQSRVLLYGPDPTCGLLLANRFLSEVPQRLALFFPAGARRVPPSGDELERGVVTVRRRRSAAALLGEVAELLERARRRWPRALRQAPRVALIEPGLLGVAHEDDARLAELDAALLSLCTAAGTTVLLYRATERLLPWWTDFDLVLHVPSPAEREALTVQVVADRVMA